MFNTKLDVFAGNSTTSVFAAASKYVDTVKNIAGDTTLSRFKIDCASCHTRCTVAGFCKLAASVGESVPVLRGADAAGAACWFGAGAGAAAAGAGAVCWIGAGIGAGVAAAGAGAVGTTGSGSGAAATAGCAPGSACQCDI